MFACEKTEKLDEWQKIEKMTMGNDQLDPMEQRMALQ
jgi:hypothetical protein